MNNIFNVNAKNVAILVASFVSIIFFLNAFNIWVLIVWGVISLILATILRIDTNPKSFEENPIVHSVLSVAVGPLGWVILTVTAFKLFKTKNNL